MAFVAPAAVRVAGGAAARSAAAGTGAKAGASAAGRSAQAAPKARPTAAPKARAPKASAAPDRARQLLREGKSPTDAALVLRDEYGSTAAEARGVVEAVDPGEAGPDTAPPAPPASTRRRPTISTPKAVRSAANAGGGAILGTLAYVLALTYLRDGPAGVKRWLRAKFLNQTDGAP